MLEQIVLWVFGVVLAGAAILIVALLIAGPSYEDFYDPNDENNVGE